MAFNYVIEKKWEGKINKWQQLWSDRTDHSIIKQIKPTYCLIVNRTIVQKICESYHVYKLRHLLKTYFMVACLERMH